MKKLLVFFILVSGFASAESYDDTMNKIIKKLTNDLEVFKQFKTLGILHCNQFFERDRNMYAYEKKYYTLYNEMYALPRLFPLDIISESFENFEKNNVNKEKKSCEESYDSLSLRNVYNDMINKKTSYYNKKNTEYFDENEMVENMQDYLKSGKINYKRFIY